MPFYEYKACNPDKSCNHCRNGFEIMHSITQDALDKCSFCGNEIVRLISQISGIIIKGRQANQYNDIKRAKYWRDHNGVRHKVTSGDGHSQSPTVSRKQTKSPEEVAAIKKRASIQRKKQRTEASYQRYVNQVKKTKRQ